MRTQPCTAGVLSRVLGLSARIAILSVLGGASSFAADPPTVQIIVPNTTPPAIQVGAAPRQFQITVANDLPGDLPIVTSFTFNGVACTAATCGSFSAVTGTPGSGSYSMNYTPPASLPGGVSPTVTVSPSLSGPSFPGTTSFIVYAAGIVVQPISITGGLNIVQAGSAVRTVTYTTYNDVGNVGLTFTLTGSGYACQDLSPNSCGTLGKPQVSTSGTTTTTIITYTPPKTKPDQPYDRVRIQATSVADPTKLANINFLLTPTPTPPVFIGYGQKFASALTGGDAVTVAFPFADATAAKSTNWKLTANGALCPAAACGTLGTPTVTTNGNAVTSTVTYTPPASVPTGSGQNFPTITVAATANPAVTDSFSFHIVDGTCGIGNETVLNGQYAFLLKGGSATGGYEARVGSFTADGSGNITGGLVDINRSSAVLTGATLTGSYSVGPDNRGCVTLTNSNGGIATFRIALGTISGGAATQGTMTAFIDTTGQNARLTGILKQQNLTNLSSSTFSGTYAFGWEGIDSSGYRVAAAGLVSPDGAGNVTNITFDVNDNGTLVTLTGASGSYSLATNAPGGRGIGQTVISIQGGAVTANYALYVISPSDFFIISTDPTDASHPIFSGEGMLQIGPFSTSVLASGNGYVFYASGVDASNGATNITLGQAEFTNAGTGTVTIDVNDNGIDGAEVSLPVTFTVDSNGRMTGAGLPPVIYLVDSTQGFLIGAGGSVGSGYIQQQTVSSFTTSTVSGQFFFGGGAATIGGPFESGIVNFSPGTPSSTITGTVDSSRPNFLLGCVQDCGGGGGLQTNNSFSAPYAFPTAPVAPGQVCLFGDCPGDGTLGYIISPMKMVLMQTGTPTNTNPAEIIIVQQ